jgi:hypothetical protein
MAIETLEDIIEEMADRIGIYGACGSTCTERNRCRVCWTSNLDDRLMAAFYVHQKLAERGHV